MAGSRVLIVEDEILIALDTEAALLDAGHEPVGIATTRDEAIRCLDEKPDVALVDLQLADGLTGPDIAAELVSAGVKVVFVTANPTILRGQITSALGIVEKPANIDVLVDVVAWASAGGNPPRGVSLPF